MFYSGVFGYFSFVSLYCTPTNPGSFVWFSFTYYFRRRGSKTAVLTHDITVDEGRKMADRVITSPARLCSRDGKLCWYRRLGYAFFCFFFLASFLLFYFCASLSLYFSLLRVASSLQQISAPLQELRVFFVSFVFSLTPEFLLFERSEFLIATCKKKKTDSLCVCVCMFG